jgi:GDP-L-fucose synthase
MDKDLKIFIAEEDGIAGKNLLNHLKETGFNNVITIPPQLDLTDQNHVRKFFFKEKPEYVFLATSVEGGIQANISLPAELSYINLQMQLNIIHSAYLSKVKKLLFFGSSCVYPRLCPQPIKEEYLLTGPLELTNEAYAIAKIAGIKMCQAYNTQYGTNFISAIPANIYGPNDNFDLKTSHVLPANIRKFHEAKISSVPEVVIWGTGKPRREFLYIDDFADACIFLMENYDRNEPINMGCGEDISIRELAFLIKRIVGYEGKIAFDRTKPDGMPKKLLDNTKIVKMGWKPKTSLENGIKATYDWYLKKIYRRKK